MPKERDYGYFLLHLEEQKASSEYMAAEEAVLEHLKTGAVDWLPDERCPQLAIEAGESTRVDQVRCHRSEKGVRLAQTMQVGPCIPVGTKL